MATNPYFQNGFSDNTHEHELLHDLTIENIKMIGQDVYYIPRKTIVEDKILNEIRMDSFQDAYCIEMYFESSDGLEGQEDTLTKFGFELRDEFRLMVSRQRFKEETHQEVGPLEGDLIYLPISNHLFEILKVERDKPFHPIGVITTWSIRCRAFRYNYQQLTTGLKAIDDIDKITQQSSDQFANNTTFHQESRKVINFDEKNPFGEF